MKTEAIYLTDPYKKELAATITSVSKIGENTYIVNLDKTIFYPMGGGQPTDQGTIVFDNNEAVVYQVLLQHGSINHYIKTNIEPKVNQTVSIRLDWDRRLKNMKVHTAGHIVDFALYKLGLTPEKLKPLKADHGKKPYIQYEGKIAQDIKQELQNQIDYLIKSNKRFVWNFVEYEELKNNAIYIQPNLPENKPLRQLTLEGVGSVADGGTILSSTGEIDEIIIIEITTNNGITEIHYKISDKNNSKKKQTSQSTDLSHFSELVETIKTEIAKSNSEVELTELWRKYLGKNGQIKSLLKEIPKIEPEKRKEYGQGVNALSNFVNELINNAKKVLTKKKEAEYLKTRKVELNLKKAKIGHKHPLTQTEEELNKIFERLGYSIYDGPELETAEYNFIRCNVPADHPAMDLQDSIYIEEPNVLLRTQTSSMEARALETLKPPFKIVMPGRVYRNEKVNKSNHFTFHQYQLVCVQEKVSMVELISTIEHLFKTYLGEDIVTRYRSKYYPEVEPGIGPDIQCTFCSGKGCVVCKHRGWIEMAGAGIIHPNMLRMAGLDPNKWQGYAFGLGLDRWAMVKHDIGDIRALLGGNLAYKPQN